MSDQRTIWIRRAVLMAVVGLLIAIPVTIAVRDGSSDEDTETAAPTPQLPDVGKVEFDRDLGVELRVPEGWKRVRRHGALTYRSSGREVVIAVSSPGPRKDADAIQREARLVAEEQYEKARIADRLEKVEVGNRPASGVVLSARRRGAPLRILIVTARGEKRAYLIQVLAAGSAGLVEGQALLNNLRLEG